MGSNFPAWFDHEEERSSDKVQLREFFSPVKTICLPTENVDIQKRHCPLKCVNNLSKKIRK